jgi:hypothetical protein
VQQPQDCIRVRRVPGAAGGQAMTGRGRGRDTHTDAVAVTMMVYTRKSATAANTRRAYRDVCTREGGCPSSAQPRRAMATSLRRYCRAAKYDPATDTAIDSVTTSTNSAVGKTNLNGLSVNKLICRVTIDAVKMPSAVLRAALPCVRQRQGRPRGTGASAHAPKDQARKHDDHRLVDVQAQHRVGGEAQRAEDAILPRILADVGRKRQPQHEEAKDQPDHRHCRRERPVSRVSTQPNTAVPGSKPRDRGPAYRHQRR